MNRQQCPMSLKAIPKDYNHKLSAMVYDGHDVYCYHFHPDVEIDVLIEAGITFLDLLDILSGETTCPITGQDVMENPRLWLQINNGAIQMNIHFSYDGAIQFAAETGLLSYKEVRRALAV